MVLRENLNVMQGDCKFYILNFTDENDVPIDISDWTIYFTAKEKMADTDNDAVIKKDIVTHSDPTKGISQITLNSTDTNRTGNYYYDIQIKKADDTVITILKGKITFENDITRRT